MATLFQCLQHAYLEVLGDPLENGGPTDCCTQQFSRGFWIKIRHLKGKNKREMSRRLVPNGLEI